MRLTGKEIGKFIRTEVDRINGYDGYDVNSLKTIVEKAIEQFQIDARIELVGEDEEIETIFIGSRVDYENLNRIVSFAVGDGEPMTVDFLYEDCVELEFING